MINRQRKKMFLAYMLTGIISYWVLISNALTNSKDGMWQGAYYSGYRWVVSIGRWFWPLIGIARNNQSPEPFTSVVSIAMIACGACIVVSLLNNDVKPFSYITGMCIMVNTAVLVRLSYRFMSPTFGMSFLLSVASCWVVIKLDKWWRWFASTVLVMLTLAAYQADLGCTCILYLMYFIELVWKGESLRKVYKMVAKVGLVLLAGCALYKLAWEGVLAFFRVGAANYKGAGTISISQIIMRMPQRVEDAYQAFAQYYSGRTSILHHTFQKTPLFCLIWLGGCSAILALIISAFKRAGNWREGALRSLIITALCILLPVAANIALLLSPESGSVVIQMTMPMAMLSSCLISLGCDAIESRGGGGLRYMLAIVLAFLLYGNLLQCSTDQHVMLTSRGTTLSLMNRVFSDLEHKELLNADRQFVFVGTPSNNIAFKKDDLWDDANLYTHYGEFTLYSNNGIQSYVGLMRDCGVAVKINGNLNFWSTIKTRQDLLDMPTYPSVGYAIEDEEGNIIVKLSDYDDSTYSYGW